MNFIFGSRTQTLMFVDPVCYALQNRQGHFVANNILGQKSQNTNLC